MEIGGLTATSPFSLCSSGFFWLLGKKEFEGFLGVCVAGLVGAGGGGVSCVSGVVEGAGGGGGGGMVGAAGVLGGISEREAVREVAAVRRASVEVLE